MKTDNVLRACLFALSPMVLALFAAGCSGDSGPGTAITTPISAPSGIGAADTAPVQEEGSVLPYVDHAYTNQRGYAQYSSVATNAGVRVVGGLLNLWMPSTELVDAGVTAPAIGRATTPAITFSVTSTPP